MRYLWILALLALAAGTCADVFWDNGGPDGRNGLSCVYWPSYPIYTEVVDDFDVGDPAREVTGGHFSVVIYHGQGPSAIEAVKVLFFEDVGNEPSRMTYAERACQFDAYLTGSYYFNRPEVAIDVTFEAITIDSGKWWVCFQPQVEDLSFWLTAPSKGESVWIAHQDLIPRWMKGYQFFGEDYDVSFRLTGVVIPEPGVMSLAGLLLGAAAIWLRRK
jgi:hypothetical protein